VPTPDDKAKFKAAAAPVYDWFKKNIKNGPAVFDALTKAAAEAEAKVDAALMADTK